MGLRSADIISASYFNDKIAYNDLIELLNQLKENCQYSFTIESGKYFYDILDSCLFNKLLNDYDHYYLFVFSDDGSFISIGRIDRFLNTSVSSVGDYPKIQEIWILSSTFNDIVVNRSEPKKIEMPIQLSKSVSNLGFELKKFINHLQDNEKELFQIVSYSINKLEKIKIR